MIKICIFIAPIFFSIMNFDAYLKGEKPSMYQLLFSILFIGIWFLYGVYMGKKKADYFLKLCTIYWGTGLLLFAVGYFNSLLIIVVPSALYFAGPLYGLRYLLDMPPDIKFVALSIVLIYILSVMGYIVGRNLKKP